MHIRAYRLRVLKPPKDSVRAAIRGAHLRLQEGDIVAISSKIIAIDEGRCILGSSIDKMKLIKQEADFYLLPKKSAWRSIFTIAGSTMVGSAGIDESNGQGHYILYPKDPKRSAQLLRAWLRKEFKLKNLGVIITDSTSVPLRRGALGFALGWSGFRPLKDYRGTRDLFDREFVFEVANIADGLAAAANLTMGEGNERTPLAVIRDAPGVVFTSSDREPKGEELAVAPANDLFAPLFWAGKKWKSNKK